MASRKSRSDRESERPESESPLPPDDATPSAAGGPETEERIAPQDGAPDDLARDDLARDHLTAEHLTPQAAAPAGGEHPEPAREDAGAPEDRIAPEEMPPLDADEVGPEPDPAAAEGLEPDATLAAGTGPDPAARAAREAPDHDAQTHPEERGSDAAPGAFAAAPSPDGDRGSTAPLHGSAEPTGASPRDEHGDEGGRSIAGTLLVALLLLLAGAALGIWAAPQIAPRLPSGMAPVADWLSPRDGEVETRLGAVETEAAAASEELRAEIATLREELAAATAEPEVDGAELEARLTELEDRLAGRVEELAAELEALDGGATRERISQLEAGLGGVENTLASLREQLAQAEAAGDDSAEINAYRAEVEGLRGEMEAIAGQVGQLSRRIDEVAAQAQRQIDLARAQVEEIEAEAAQELGQAETAAALAQIRSSLESGAPFNEPLMRLASHSESSVPATLTNPAPEGVATLQELRDTFPEAANSAIRASVQSEAEGGGVLARLRGFAEAQVASRSLEPREGSDADAVLSRMEQALRDGDTDAALAEAEALPPAAAEAMGDWLAAARARQEAVESFEALQAELSATN